MRVLVTSSRFPHALCEIRRFGEQGHAVFAADTFRNAPGSHSRYVREAFVVASPTFAPDRFVAEIDAIIDAYDIDLVVPEFEEALPLAARADRLHAHAFCAPFETIARLHDKYSFVKLAEELGAPVPATIRVESRGELADAQQAFPRFIARPVHSRGGCVIYTNTGPLAGRASLDDCDPTPTHPWIVQEFVRGTEVCSFSVARHGRVVAHCTYEHPKTIEHAGGILFVSRHDPEALELAQRFVTALDYDGQISFDFVRTTHGLVLIECNPRATIGVSMMSSADFCDAVFDRVPQGEVRVVPAGVRRQIGVALVRDMFRNWREIANDLDVLSQGIEDVYAAPDDAMPAIYSLLTYGRVREFRRRMHVAQRSPVDLVAAQFFDVLWDGEQRGAT